MKLLWIALVLALSWCARADADPPFSDTGSTGRSLCSNGTTWVACPAATPPGVGTDASSGAPSGFTNLLASFTVANPGAYRIQNQSAVTLAAALCTSAGVNCTFFLLAPGAGANAQGADTSPEIPWFTGYVGVYGAAGSQFSARHN